MRAMNLLVAKDFEDYELIDSGDGKRFERFGKYKLIRPDPQIIWKKGLDESQWNSCNVVFENERWKKRLKMADKWLLRWRNISFYAKLTPFKHTGVFPEQSIHWEYIGNKVKNANREVNILNLFAYTGIASLVAASAGARVTHLDASIQSMKWSKENQAISNLGDKPIRWILDDAIKFTKREIKRKKTYDGIIMDPPVYGHGPGGETWDFNKSLPILLDNCSKIISQNPLFVIMNAYAISSSSETLKNILRDFFPEMIVESGELGIKEKSKGRILSTGIFARAT
ncbi:MAG: hypothetical protein A2687_04935 [Candidatus Levybacteria bacterium RIFCSPHIGHO2_01_FULL_38_26]|nr:MAG: hypothetical protein A2687_04935 [Candidatus Levybacteria bacterium RIFCSPHIGHO2_01_FULL_38_26]